MTNCTKIHSFVTCLFPFGFPQNNWKSNPALGNKKKKCCVPSIWPKDLDISTRQSDRVTTSRKHPFMDAAAHGKCPQASGPPLFRSQTDKLQGMLVIFHVKCLQMLNLTGCGELRNITQFLEELAFTHIESCRLAFGWVKRKILALHGHYESAKCRDALPLSWHLCRRFQWPSSVEKD